ncbi:hypothetical protein FACS1894163_08380 [Spirochaetia bacterium]|nr:hypothetical protein FACS1894163_08380 [Spirochaetia bacterium]
MICIGERNYPAFIDGKSKYLFKGTPIAHPTVIIRTEILKKYLYNTDTSSNEDIDLWFRLLLDGYSIENINEPLIKYRITSKTFQRRNYKKALNEFKIYWHNLIKLHGISLLLIYPLVRFISRLLPAGIIKKLYLSKERLQIINQSQNTPPFRKSSYIVYSTKYFKTSKIAEAS